MEADGSAFDQGWFDRRLAGWLNPETAETFGIVRSIREAVNKEIEPLRCDLNLDLWWWRILKLLLLLFVFDMST